MRHYAYVGPAQIRAAAVGAKSGFEVLTIDDLARWLSAHAADREATGIPATFVVSTAGILRLASRRSEHVACAAGEDVLAAGEMFFDEGRVTAVSNLSTGFCPEPESWSAVASALDRACVPHPGRFTNAFLFRRCPACGERNLIKDDFFVCVVCDAELPKEWNFSAR